MYGCIKKVLIQGVIPCMPRGSLIWVPLSSSSVPRIPIHRYIKKIIEKQYVYIYIRKSEKGWTLNVMFQLKILHSTPPKDRSSYALSQITPLN